MKKKSKKINIYDVVGQRVREERLKAGFTLEELSEAASISPSFLAYIERGEKKASLATIEKLSRGLQIPISAFFSRMPSPRLSIGNKAVKQLSPLLKEKRPSDRKLLMDILKTLAKRLPKR